MVTVRGCRVGFGRSVKGISAAPLRVTFGYSLQLVTHSSPLRLPVSLFETKYHGRSAGCVATCGVTPVASHDTRMKFG